MFCLSQNYHSIYTATYCINRKLTYHFTELVMNAENGAASILLMMIVMMMVVIVACQAVDGSS
jgi:hypothetical protein